MYTSSVSQMPLAEVNSATAYDMFCTVSMAIFCLIGSLSNMLIIGAILAEKQLNVLGNVFIINLAASDLYVTAIAFPVAAGNNMVLGGILSKQGCVLVGAITGWCTICSLLNISCISLERYIYICHNTFYKRYLSSWVVVMMVILLWVTSSTFFLPAIQLGGDIIIYEPRMKLCTYNIKDLSTAFLVTLLIAALLFPIMICFICYFNIFRTVYLSRKRIADVSSVNQSRGVSKKDLALYKTLFTVFAVYLLLCLPSASMLFLLAAGIPIPDEIIQWATYFCLLNSVVNGFIYGMTNRQFRKGYMKCLAVFFCSRITTKTEMAAETTISQY